METPPISIVIVASRPRATSRTRSASGGMAARNAMMVRSHSATSASSRESMATISFPLSTALPCMSRRSASAPRIQSSSMAAMENVVN